MSEGVRVIRPDRAQLRWDMVDLDSQLPDDHRARLVWAFVETLDLSEFYDRIKARDAVAGRPATDPQVVLAVWLYATLEGIGSARACGLVGSAADPERDRADRRKAAHFGRAGN
jgi:transposase